MRSVPYSLRSARSLSVSWSTVTTSFVVFPSAPPGALSGSFDVAETSVTVGLGSTARARELVWEPWLSDRGDRHERPDAGRDAAAGPAARALPHRPGPRAPTRLRRPAAAVQRRLPGRREHPGLARRTPRRAGTSRRGVSSSPTIRCPRSTGGSATTRARASATAPTSTAPSRSIRSSGSWATSRSSRGGTSTLRRSAAASGCSWSAPGRAVCRPPTT